MDRKLIASSELLESVIIVDNTGAMRHVLTDNTNLFVERKGQLFAKFCIYETSIRKNRVHGGEICLGAYSTKVMKYRNIHTQVILVNSMW